MVGLVFWAALSAAGMSSATAACPPPPQESSGMGRMIGGFGGAREPKQGDHVYEVMEKASATKRLLKYSEQEGHDMFVASQLCYYTTQVVAGTNYKLVFSTGEGPNSLFDMVIYEPLPYTGEPPQVTSIKAAKAQPAQEAASDPETMPMTLSRSLSALMGLAR